ncbi:MAG: prepilin-type N-terminal cleavage/methylation domain-containing protein [Phycisphaerales bacterium]|nr:prepilin-type N-terminal cleavage/methylation domain-containing protein [Phycisphaerales bacterium]
MRQRAFTLLEILVVIAIIALLIGILTPALSAARDRAKTAKCLSNLRSLGTGSISYSVSSDGYLCSGQADARPGMNLDASITNLAQTGIDRVGWIADLANSQLCLPGKLLCPGNLGQQTQSWGRALTVPGGSSYYTPGNFINFRDNLGYNSNYCQSWYMAHTQYDGTTALVFNRDLMHGSMGPLKVAMMANADASRVPLLGDARAARDEVFNHSAQGYGAPVRETKSVTDGPWWQDQGSGSYALAPYSSFRPYGIQDWDDFGPAHRGRPFQNDEEHGFTAGNLLFGDGHAETFRDEYDFDGGVIRIRPDGELDSWDLRGKVFDGVLTLGRRSISATTLE